MQWRYIKNVFIFALTAVILEWLCYLTLPYKRHYDGKDRRNPHFRRGWPEYTNSHQRKSNCIRIAFVGNSQGFGREILGTQLYTTRFQEILEIQKDKNFEILNWSAPGAITHDLFVLSAKALAQKMDYLFIVTYSQNFMKTISRQPLSYSILDVPYIIGDFDTFRLLPKTFLQSYVSPEFICQAFLYRQLSVLRIGDHLRDGIEKFTTGAESFEWLYNGGGAGMRQLLYERGPVENSILYSDADINYLSYIDSIFRKNQNTKVIFVLMPLARSVLTEESINITEKFNRDVIQHYQNSNVRVWDLTWSLPDSQFYSHTHFSAKNHQAFANILYEYYVQISH